MMCQISNLCIATKKPGLSHSLFSVRAASLRQRQRGWNCQIRSLWGRSRHNFSYWWEVWGFTCYTETGQRGKGLLHTAGPGFQQDHGPPSGACYWIHCQDTWHQWQWAQIYQGCLHCQCTWNVRRRWVNENYFPLSVVIWSAFTVMLKYCTRVWYSCHCSVFKVMDASVPLVFLRVFFFSSSILTSIWSM